MSGVHIALRTLWMRIDFPLKRSSAAALSDRIATRSSTAFRAIDCGTCFAALASPLRLLEMRDRKSTRLNSSHGYISYAVFCLKKKKNNSDMPRALIADDDTRRESSARPERAGKH